MYLDDQCYDCCFCRSELSHVIAVLQHDGLEWCDDHVSRKDGLCCIAYKIVDYKVMNKNSEPGPT